MTKKKPESRRPGGKTSKAQAGHTKRICLNCEQPLERDYRVCVNCEPFCHFTIGEDCCCRACKNKRELARLPLALRERLKGSVVIATSEDPPDSVRIKLRFDLLKPERRPSIARAIVNIFGRLIEEEGSAK